MNRFNWCFLFVILYIYVFQTDVNGANLTMTRKLLKRSSRFRSLYTADKYMGRTIKERDGVYYTTIKIGTPPIDVTVIVDSGSSSIAVPCFSKYNPKRSTTSEITDDIYIQCYGEGSCNSGFWIKDDLIMGNTSYPTMSVGCCTHLDDLFLVQEADGILGLSQSNKIDQVTFCFGEEFGRMFLNEEIEHAAVESFQWTKRNEYEAYTMNIQYLRDISHKMKNWIAIVDTGTTFTYFPKELFDPLSRYLNDYVWSRLSHRHHETSGAYETDEYDSPLCIRLGNLNELYPAFPPIYFVMQDATFVLRPEHYLFKSGSGLCVGIFEDSNEDSEFITLGANALVNHTFIFNHVTGDIGFAYSDCLSLV